MMHDVFICHASEDKDLFVRDLAEALTSRRVEVWYDEFSLKPGDSLRRSIDYGLRSSTLGIVVLSKPFFSKAWSQWELDGLVQREIYGTGKVIVPVWLDVERDDVASYSLSLADRVALKAKTGTEAVADGILSVLRPEGSTLLVARELAMKLGADVPIVTDDWWLDALEHSSVQFDRPWFFPLRAPSEGQSPMERGEALAWVALQEMWQDAAEKDKISQVSYPKTVVEFICDQPGLRQLCDQFPDRLAIFAPQLTITGFGGPFETAFDEMLRISTLDGARRRERGDKSGSGLTQDGKSPHCDDEIALRHPIFGGYDAAHIACGFVQGFGAGLGPAVQAHDCIDYAIWFLSARSCWLPKTHHHFLLEGMKRWAVWPWTGRGHGYSGYKVDGAGALCDALVDAKSMDTFQLCGPAETDLFNRVTFSKKYLDLPESTDELAHRFLSSEFIAYWFAERT